VLASLMRYFQDRTPIQLLRDALDVFLVYYLFYRALLVLRGTRAMQVGVGLGVVFLLYAFAQLFQLVTMLSVLGALLSSIILVIVVVFQSDIRRGLQRVGSRALIGGFGRAGEMKVIDEVVEAATELARHRIGAIVAFEQDANLDEFVGIHKGHIIDAAVTSELLVSLFVPEGVNKLHDGAVIIRNLRIAKAGVFFPMAENKVMDESFGSRHRAAIGITEETDAVVVVVSEERGTISFGFNGNIASNLDGPKLRTMLEAIFSPKVRAKKRKAPKRAEAEATPVSAGPAASERTRPPPSVRIVEPDTAPEERGSLPSIPEEEPAPRRDSEPPPPPLRPRVVTAETEAVQSTRTPLVRPSAAPPPLRTPVGGRPAEVARTGMPRVPETARRVQRPETDDGDDDPGKPERDRS
jgi:diadenylate cyclase